MPALTVAPPRPQNAETNEDAAPNNNVPVIAVSETKLVELDEKGMEILQVFKERKEMDVHKDEAKANPEMIAAIHLLVSSKEKEFNKFLDGLSAAEKKVLKPDRLQGNQCLFTRVQLNSFWSYFAGFDKPGIDTDAAIAQQRLILREIARRLNVLVDENCAVAAQQPPAEAPAPAGNGTEGTPSVDEDAETLAMLEAANREFDTDLGDHDEEPASPREVNYRSKEFLDNAAPILNGKLSAGFNAALQGRYGKEKAGKRLSESCSFCEFVFHTACDLYRETEKVVTVLTSAIRDTIVDYEKAHSVKVVTTAPAVNTEIPDTGNSDNAGSSNVHGSADPFAPPPSWTTANSILHGGTSGRLLGAGSVVRQITFSTSTNNVRAVGPHYVRQLPRNASELEKLVKTCPFYKGKSTLPPEIYEHWWGLYVEGTAQLQDDGGKKQLIRSIISSLCRLGTLRWGSTAALAAFLAGTDTLSRNIVSANELSGFFVGTVNDGLFLPNDAGELLNMMFDHYDLTSRRHQKIAEWISSKYRIYHQVAAILAEFPCALWGHVERASYQRHAGNDVLYNDTLVTYAMPGVFNNPELLEAAIVAIPGLFHFGLLAPAMAIVIKDHTYCAFEPGRVNSSYADANKKISRQLADAYNLVHSFVRITKIIDQDVFDKFAGTLTKETAPAAARGEDPDSAPPLDFDKLRQRDGKSNRREAWSNAHSSNTTAASTGSRVDKPKSGDRRSDREGANKAGASKPPNSGNQGTRRTTVALQPAPGGLPPTLPVTTGSGRSTANYPEPATLPEDEAAMRKRGENKEGCKYHPGDISHVTEKCREHSGFKILYKRGWSRSKNCYTWQPATDEDQAKLKSKLEAQGKLTK